MYYIKLQVQYKTINQPFTNVRHLRWILLIVPLLYGVLAEKKVCGGTDYGVGA